MNKYSLPVIKDFNIENEASGDRSQDESDLTSDVSNAPSLCSAASLHWFSSHTHLSVHIHLSQMFPKMTQLFP